MTGPRPAVTQADLALAGSSPSQLAAALAYAALGIPVLPLHHPVRPGLSCSCGDPDHAPGSPGAREVGKHPRVHRGVLAATTDPAQIRHWWWQWPQSNIGLATGFRFDVIDADGAAALQTLTDLAQAGRAPERVAVALTGRPSGQHWVVPTAGAGNSTGSERRGTAGVDYRGAGGYVVGAPSLHRTGTAYRWGFGALPNGDESRGEAVPGPLPWERPARPAGVTERQHSYALVALTEKSRAVAEARAGERNDALHRASVRMGTMTGARWIARDDVERALLDAALSAGSDPDRSAGTVKRGLDTGESRPAPDLKDRPDRAQLTVEETVAGIRGWAESGAMRERLSAWRPPAGDPRKPGVRSLRTDRTVLEHVCATALAVGNVQVSVPLREVEKATGLGKTAVADALGRLVERIGVLRVVKEGGPGSLVGTRYELVRSVAAEFVVRADSSSAKRGGAYGTLSVLATSCTPGSRSMSAHDVMGSRRGAGHGMTRSDLLLLAVLPDADPFKVADWAKAADVHRTTAYTALRDDVPGSLASLGLVRRGAARGTAAATPEGRRLLADRGEMDALAELLGVTGRADARAARVEGERAALADVRLPEIVEDAVRGRAGRTTRAGALVRARLGEGVSAALARLLAGLDVTEGARPARRALGAFVGAFRTGDRLDDDDRRALAGWAGIDVSRPAAERFWGVAADLVPGRVWDVAAVAASLVRPDAASARFTAVGDGAWADWLTGEVVGQDEVDAWSARARAVTLVRAVFAVDPLPTVGEAGDEMRRLADEGRSPVVLPGEENGPDAPNVEPSSGYRPVGPRPAGPLRGRVGPSAVPFVSRWTGRGA